MSQRLTSLQHAARSMGWANTLLYVLKTKVLKPIYCRITPGRSSYRIGTLRTNQLKAPVLFRYNSSDVNVFSQIFVTDEYLPLGTLENVRLIVDCGAYVGYSSAYLLSRFPDARVLAIEPDARNFGVLKQNLAPYGARVDAIHAAVWSSNTGVKVSRRAIGNEAEWVTAVQPCEDGEAPDLRAMDLETLLRRAGAETIDILKIDIEGAERALFSENARGWVPKVRAFAIELHDEAGRQAFHAALAAEPFDFTASGEITIARRTSDRGKVLTAS